MLRHPANLSFAGTLAMALRSASITLILILLVELIPNTGWGAAPAQPLPTAPKTPMNADHPTSTAGGQRDAATAASKSHSAQGGTSMAVRVTPEAASIVRAWRRSHGLD